jgi:hypothetical protein
VSVGSFKFAGKKVPRLKKGRVLSPVDNLESKPRRKKSSLCIVLDLLASYAWRKVGGNLPPSSWAMLGPRVHSLLFLK